MFKYFKKLTILLLITILAFTGCTTRNTPSTADAQKLVLNFLNSYLTFTGVDKFIDSDDYIKTYETYPEKFKPLMTDACYKGLYADRFLSIPVYLANMFKCNISVSNIKQKDYKYDKKENQLVYEHTFNVVFTSINSKKSFSEPLESQIVLIYNGNKWIISNIHIPWPNADIENKGKTIEGGGK